jgi:hypothetical protein
MEDLIDRAVAERLNELKIKHLKVTKIRAGVYQIGEGPPTYLRLVREQLLGRSPTRMHRSPRLRPSRPSERAHSLSPSRAPAARVGGGWMGFKSLLLRKQSLFRRASSENLLDVAGDGAEGGAGEARE